MNQWSEEQTGLYTDNIKLVYYLANQWNCKGTGLSYYDIEDCCSFGMMKAAINYDKERGAKFSTYAAICMNNEVLMEMRRTKKNNRFYNCSLEGLTWVDEYTGDKKVFLFQAEDHYEFEDKDLINSLMMGLTEREKEIIKLNFFQDKQQYEIAYILGLSQSYVSRKIKSTLLKMRKIAKLKKAL